MQILGNYASQLSTFGYQQLVALLQQAIQLGEYSGGQAFDQTALDSLQQQAQSFANQPQPEAGQRTTDDTFNNPLSLLAARFAALLSESTAFASELSALLAVLEKDTKLIDQLIFAAALEAWAASKPALGGTAIKWDFGTGYGPVAGLETSSLWTDPVNGVVYNSRPALISLLTDQLHTGLACASTVKPVATKNMVWQYTAGQAQIEELYADTWTKLTLLDPSVLINYVPSPVAVPATNPFVITGLSNLGNLPVYVQTSFTGRRRHIQAMVTNGTSFSLSRYTLETDAVAVFAGIKAYNNVTDYTVDENGTFTPIHLDETTLIDIYYVENFPSYQCSINQKDWSPLQMLDPDRPYADTETRFLPIAFGNDGVGGKLLPITDELGVGTGMYISLTTPPTQQYLLQVSCQASPATVGATAVLEVDLAAFGFLNAIRLSPFTTFPLTLKRVETQSLTSNTRETVWEGSVTVDRATTVRFPTAAVSSLFLTFYQPNYSLKQQSVTPPDALRRDVMNQLQAILPFDARRIPPTPTVVYTGAQYEFGLENIEGELWTSQPSVFAAGPNRLAGCPDVVRFDVDFIGTIDFYLAYQAYNASGDLVDQNLSGIPVTDAQCFVFPFSSGIDRTQIDHVDFYVRVVHRDPTSLVERFMLQALNV